MPLSENEPIQLRVIAGGQTGQGQGRKISEPVSFQRQELIKILNVYGQRVSSGDWKDYAIDMTKERAIFSIFRRACDVPLFRVEKNPKLSRKQGQYSVVTGTGQILKRGHDLGAVLKVLEKREHYNEKISYFPS